MKISETIPIVMCLIGIGFFIMAGLKNTSLTDQSLPIQGAVAAVQDETTYVPTVVANVPTFRNQVDQPTLRPVTSQQVGKRIKRLVLDADRTIYLNNAIGDNALRGSHKIIQMNQKSQTKPIFVVLNSPGGSVVDGAAFIASMQVSKAPIYTVCHTFCASMAAMILQYGKKRYATDRSIIMMHPASSGVQGDVDRMETYTSAIKNFVAKIEVEVSARMGITFREYKTKTAIEYWIDSEDALKENVIDDLVYIVKTETEEKTNPFFNYGNKSNIRNILW